MGLTLGLAEGLGRDRDPGLRILGPLSPGGEGSGLCLSAIHLARGTTAAAAPLY